MLEVVQSMSLIRQAIDRYRRTDGPPGEPIKLTEKLPKGEAYLETEAPKGQMGFMVDRRRHGDPLARAGTEQLLLQPVGRARDCAAACLIADMPAIIGSLDIRAGRD